MSSLIDRYLDRVLFYADKPEPESQAIRQELEDHLWQRVDDLEGDGLPREEAILEVLSQQGHPRAAARRLGAPFPWIDIRKKGIAFGVIAIGPRAIGIVAIGWIGIGIFAFGGFPLGVFSLGAASLGVFSVGGLAAGFFSNGVECSSLIMVTLAMFWINAFLSPTAKSVPMEADWLAGGGRPAPDSSQPARLEVANEEPY